jgi:pimeloyl-ACP methyl ester carboxylesterase
VIIVHGAPDRSRNFSRVLPLLEDLPVIVYDRRGYGESLEAGNDGEGFEAHVADLLDLVDGRPSIAVGQSAGGAISMIAAARHPELFLAVGAWEPPLTPLEIWPAAMRAQTWGWANAPDADELGESYNRFLLGDERFESLSERTRSLLRAEGRAFRADMASQFDPYFEPHELITPCVIGSGAGPDSPDPGVYPSCAALLGCELLVIEGAPHGAHTTAPAAWASLVRATVALVPDRERT